MKSQSPIGSFTKSDIVNISEFSFLKDRDLSCEAFHIQGEHGLNLVVFATNLQDALDEAVDAGRLQSCSCDDEYLAMWTQEEIGNSFSRLGNFGEYHDIQNIQAKKFQHSFLRKSQAFSST